MASHPVHRFAPVPARRIARLLSLGVTPGFAVMAWSSLPTHATMSHDGYAMSVMYALMALAHLPAWLTRGCNCH